MVDFDTRGHMQQLVLKGFRYVLFGIAGLFVAQVLLLVTLDLVHALPDTQQDVALYIIDMPYVVASSTVPATTTVSYAIHNTSNDSDVFRIQGVVQDSRGGSTEVFTHQEYMQAGETRVFHEIFTTHTASSTLFIQLQNRTEQVHVIIQDPPN